MKSIVLVLLFVIYHADCRKVVPQINKNANIDFISMEGGGGVRPGANTAKAPPSSPVAASPAKPAAAPVPVPVPAAPAKPVTVTVKPAQPTLVNPPKPTQIQPKPVYPSPAAHPVTTPGPGTVKQLVNFYDSQGKASQIRPYSYSQAVKQG